MEIDIHVNDFKRIMNTCAKMLDPKHSHEKMRRICLRCWPEGRMEAVGCDGYAMGVAYVNYTAKDDSAVSELGYYDFLIDALSAPKESKYVTISDDDVETILIDFNCGVTVKQKKLDGEYISFNKIFKVEEPVYKVSVNPKLLERVMHAMRSEDDVTLCLYECNLSPIQIDGANTRGICLPVNLKARNGDAERRDEVIKFRGYRHE